MKRKERDIKKDIMKYEKLTTKYFKDFIVKNDNTKNI